MKDENPAAMLRAIRRTLSSVQRAFEHGEPHTLHTILEDVQPVVDAMMAWHQRKINAQHETSATPGNRLYDAIIARLKSHFPEASRDLDWDVLPATVGGIVKAHETIRSLNEAWNEGASAQTEGIAQEEVPYPIESEKATAWLRGWTSDAWMPGGRLHSALEEEANRLKTIAKEALDRHIRCEAERENAIVERDELRRIVNRFIEDDPCEYDHQDYCQAHGLHLRPCPQEQIRALNLARSS